MGHQLFISCLRGYDEVKSRSLQLSVVLIDSRPWHFENSRLIGNFPGRKYFQLGVKYQIILERYQKSLHKSFIILISSCFSNLSFDKLKKISTIFGVGEVSLTIKRGQPSLNLIFHQLRDLTVFMYLLMSLKKLWIIS